MRPQPMLVVRDVEASSQWYQRVLGLESGHGGDEYEQLLAEDGRVVLQLHHLDAHEHPLLGEPPSSGIAVWFETDVFDDILRRIVEASTDIAQGPAVNPLAHHREIWLHDPDGHVIVVSSPFGDTGPATEEDP